MSVLSCFRRLWKRIGNLLTQEQREAGLQFLRHSALGQKSGILAVGLLVMTSFNSLSLERHIELS